jgi:hypothetical protein
LVEGGVDGEGFFGIGNEAKVETFGHSGLSIERSFLRTRSETSDFRFMI